MTPILAGFAMELGLFIGQLWLGPLLRALSDADVTVGTKVLIDRAYPSMCVFAWVCFVGWQRLSSRTLQDRTRGKRPDVIYI